MSDPAMSSHEHDELDECVRALESVHAFLHHELSEADADVIRHHLHACERCMENFEIESTITEMIHRSQRPAAAPQHLVSKVSRLRIRPSA